MTRGRLAGGIGVLSLALLLGGQQVRAQEGAAWYEQARRGREYRVPDAVELAAAQRLFVRTLTGEEGESLAADWKAFGFELRSLPAANGPLLVLQERPEARRGRGFYLLRRSGAVGLCWQAPHSFRDEGTGALALLLMQEGRAFAASWNTVPRDLDPAGHSDLAHAEESYLTAFTRALLQVRPQLRVVQLHGFAKHKRITAAGNNADLILSGGERSPDPPLTGLGDCLQRALPLPVRLYPSQVRELGGTSNRIGRLLRQGGAGDFLHLEMSPDLRSLLRTEDSFRRNFAACLGDQP